MNQFLNRLMGLLSFMNKLGKELSLLIMLKLVIIYGVWLLCFSHPIEKSKIKQHVSEHIYG